MSKAAVKRKTTTKTASDVKQYIDEFQAKSMFFSAALNLSWRLAATVLIPIFIGVKADEYFDSGNSYTITGFMIAVVFGSMAVWKTVKEVGGLTNDMIIAKKPKSGSKK